MVKELSKAIELVMEHFDDPRRAVMVVAWIIGNYFRHFDAWIDNGFIRVLSKYSSTILENLDDVIEYAVMFHNESRPMTDVFRGAVYIRHFLHTHRNKGAE